MRKLKTDNCLGYHSPAWRRCIGHKLQRWRIQPPTTHISRKTDRPAQGYGTQQTGCLPCSNRHYPTVHIENIDLEYDRAATRTLVQIKSGPNWGNASQKRALQERFASATRTLKQGSASLGKL